METFVTAVMLLAMVAVGVLLIHRLNTQHDERIAVSLTVAPGRLSGGRRRRPRRSLAVVPGAVPAIAATGDVDAFGRIAGPGPRGSE
ncbi:MULTISPECIES: hypothetical protein [unclassified Streptomyces]|uniref:hypothetical protein n=1 Tax=unclassified Streptomyces TaxID=2593676 RepID=UPI0036ED470A